MTSGPMGDDEGLLTEEEAAAILRLSLPAVRKLRLAGSGPPHVMIGRQTRYRQAVVVQGWLAGEGQCSSAADNRWQPWPSSQGGKFTGLASRVQTAGDSA